MKQCLIPEITDFNSSLVAQTAKIIASILKKDRKINEEVLVEDQFGFRRRKENRNSVGMLRITSERTLNTDE
jgi:hypothetical protein